MKKTLDQFEIKSLGRPDEIRTFEKGKVELVEIGGTMIGRATFEPGWRWSECVGPIAKTESCQAAHYGYQLSGTMKVVMDDGSEKTIRPGEAFNIPSGHDAWVEGEEAVVAVDFQGMVDYAKPKEKRRGPGSRRH